MGKAFTPRSKCFHKRRLRHRLGYDSPADFVPRFLPQQDSTMVWWVSSRQTLVIAVYGTYGVQVPPVDGPNGSSSGGGRTYMAITA